jgi:hypothetical protein
MPTEDLTQLAKRLSREFELHEEKLVDALGRALEAHSDEARFETGQTRRTTNRSSVAPLHAAMARVQQLWRGADPDVRDDVLWFVGEEGGSDHVDRRIDYLTELFEEYGGNYARQRGNPGTSRGPSTERLPLEPLRAFAEVLIALWTQETGRPFGHAVETTDDLAATIRDASSPSMKFLSEAVGLTGRPYSIGNLETVVRGLKAGRDQLAQRHDP